MVDNSQSSFIPRKSVDSRPGKRKSVSGVGFLRTASVIIFVIVIIAAVGVFLYGQLLERNIARKEDALARAREAFEPKLIEELSRLDLRIDSADSLIGSHIAPTQLFELIESITLQTVRFSNFSFNEDLDGYLMTLDGEGQSFASVALQSDSLGESPFVIEPVVSDLVINPRGKISFSVTAKVDPSVFIYSSRASQETVDLLEDELLGDGDLGELDDLLEELEDLDESLQ